MRARIGRTVIAALAIEGLAIALLFVLVAMFGPHDGAAAPAYAERLGQWVGPVSGAALCSLGGWWLTRKLSSGHVLHGLALGALAAAIDIALLLMSGAAFRMVYVVSNGARLACGGLGGWLASGARRQPAESARLR
jgi:hypothetical protein